MWTCPKCGEKIEDQFDSCWKCAAEPKQTLTSVSRPLFFSTAVAAILAPLLADGLHTLVEFQSDFRFYRAAFGWYLNSTAGACLFVGVRAAVTFPILWYVARHGFRGRIIWAFITLLWLLADFLLEPSLRR
jgi:hypothetical protein